MCVYVYILIYIYTQRHIYVCFTRIYLPMQYIKVRMVKLKY